MRNFLNWRRALVVAGVLLLATTPVMAQQTSGNLYGTVSDTDGNDLPGVTVTVTGGGAPQIQVTDAQGAFRFLGLSPGVYSVLAELDGFSTIDYPNVRVNVARNTTIEVSMNAAIEETITVTSESPLLDERRVATGATVTQVELEKIPTARDPWVILQSVPGVLVDRVNVGGNQSGQQSNFVGNGSGRASATWNVDGVAITDPAARGASPTYYNFDAFEEMQMSTGGSDVAAMTSGVQLNLVTKRGTNEWRGSARYFNTGEGQADSDISASQLGSAGPWNGNNGQGASASSIADVEEGNQTENIDEWGADLGGPIVKDRLWIWGSYSFQDIEVVAFGGSPDATELENYAAKLNAQLSSSNSAVLFYHYGDKQKFGRGAGPQRPPNTTWNQTGPTDIYKVEDTHIFNSNFYLTAQASYVGGGFALDPIGGLDGPDRWRQANRVWANNSYLAYETVRPQDQAKLDGSYFFNTGNANHELKFGVNYRKSEVTSLTQWSGNGLDVREDFGAFGANGDGFLAFAWQAQPVNDSFEVWTVTLQDTITTGNLTINAGLRYDLQQPEGGSSAFPANPLFPNDLPAFTKPAADIPFEWETISPRIGLTYALGEERKTLLRASYSRFVDQLGTGFFSDLGSATFSLGYLYVYDRNNNDVVDPGEAAAPFYVAGNPGAAATNVVDPGLDPSSTDEIVLGVEHALLPELVIGASATIRQNNDFVDDFAFVQDAGTGNRREIQRSDFVQTGTLSGTLPNGSSYSYPVFGLRSGVALHPDRGFIRKNNDRSQDYLGLSLNFNKRLSNRWMLRGHFTWSDWTTEDLTASTQRNPNRFVNAQNGSQVLVQSAGSGSFSETWINSTWSFNLSGLYQIAPDRPWGFNVAADINGREGYAIPYRVSVPAASALVGADRIAGTFLVSPDNDSFRNDDVILTNLRIEKEFTFSNFGLTVGADVFNIFNDNSTLQTEGFLAATGTTTSGQTVNFNSSNGDWIREAVSPRIWRLGVRLSFN